MIMDLKYISNTLDHCGRQEFKMQSSSPDSNPSSSSLIYNDSGYITHINHETQSLSTNSEPSLEEVSLHSRQGEPPATLHTTNSVYFCEDAVFDEPKLEGPPLLCHNSNNYEEFSSLIKFSLEDTSSSYITNDAYLRDDSKYLNDYCDNTSDRVSEKVSAKDEEGSTTVLQYLNTDSLSSYSSSMNPSQSICVSEVHDRQSIISQAVEQCLTISISQNNEEIKETFDQSNSSTTVCTLDKTNTPDTSQNTMLEQSESSTTCSFSSKLVNCTPTKTFINTVNPDLSPELFSDDEDELQSETSIITENLSITQKSFTQDEDVMKNDRKLLKRVQENLTGVPPPPSVTILQLTAADMLNKINNNKYLFLTNSEISDNKCDKSLLIVNSKAEVDNSVWPDILTCRYHGLHYNRSKVSEDFEHYCTKYAARYVGAETASSCTVWSTMAPSSATKRRNARLRWGIKSPGRRLSHLARRRITFSSSNLQQAGTNLSVIGNSSGARQLMIDARKSALLQKRKSPRKSPWKRSPRKSPTKRVKTPNSSAKKRAVRRLMLGADDDAKPGTSKVSSTKRALFQSPDHTRSTIASTDQFLQKNKPKRALFMSPNKNSPSKTAACDKKRKRAPDEECHPSKFPRSLSFDAHHSSALNEAATSGGTLQRRNSEVIIRPNTSKGELSDLHRKKLLWAVSEALRAQQISMSHPQFRTFASILCKVVKHLMPDLLANGPRQPGSTSDRMLRIARQHCYAVTRGKTFEEILQQVKEANVNLKNLKPPTGYVSLEQAKAVQVKNVLQDKVMNIESNSAKKRSPVEMKVDTKIDENNKLRNIRRQIIFDDNEITKSHNPHR